MSGMNAKLHQMKNYEISVRPPTVTSSPCGKTTFSQNKPLALSRQIEPSGRTTFCETNCRRSVSFSYQPLVPAWAGTPRYEKQICGFVQRIRAGSLPIPTPPGAGDKPPRYIDCARIATEFNS